MGLKKLNRTTPILVEPSTGLTTVEWYGQFINQEDNNYSQNTNNNGGSPAASATASENADFSI